MQKLYSTIFILVLVAGFTILTQTDSVSAQDPYPEPPEIGSPEDNACNLGGILDQPDGNVCTTEWHWRCGWFLARFYFLSYFVGSYDTSLVPVECDSLLPLRPVSSSVANACIINFNSSGNGNVDVTLGSFNMSAGSSLTITMTTDPGLGTGFVISSNGNPLFGSTIFTTPHIQTFNFATATPNVTVLLDWQTNGLASNTYTFSRCG